MKNILFLFAVLQYCGSTAQTYTFDYLLTINSKDLNNPKENSTKITGIHNSKNNDFEMMIRSDDVYIFDYKKNVIQKFYIKSTSNKSLEFIYNKPSNFRSAKLFYNIKKIDDLEFFIEVFNNKKKVKPTIIITVKLKESKENFIYLEGHFNGKTKSEIENKMKSMLDPTKKFVVESSIIEYERGEKYHHEYAIYEKVNLNLEVN